MSLDPVTPPSTPPDTPSTRPPVPNTELGPQDLSSRPPLKTLHAHIYSFTPRRRTGPTAHRDSLYVNSPSPPDTDQATGYIRTFRPKRAGHVPIVITQELVNRVIDREHSRQALKDRSVHLASRLVVSRRPQAYTERLLSETRGTDHRFQHPSSPTCLFTKPKSLTPVSYIIPPLNSIGSFDSSFSDALVSKVGFDPLTPAGSRENTPRTSAVQVAGPPSPPLTMSRPATGHGNANEDGNALSVLTSPYNLDKIPAGLTSSQVSFASDLGRSVEDASALTDAQGKDATSLPQSAKTVTSPTTELRTPTTGSNNLSGLVCNVHRCTGKEPKGLVGATTTILGDKLYVFGGRSLSRRRPHMTSDLYELDLIHRHWSKIRTKGQTPSPRYFHSVCALGDSKLICYGGMSPALQTVSGSQLSPNAEQADVEVMSDVHIYDTKTRTWTRIDTQDTPQGRYAHCAAVLPSTAVFSSANAPLAAIHHNPSEGDNPNSGQLGIALDGTGGAEMVVVGGQDNANHYIEQISVFNLRSLKWTATNSLGRSCGAYRSVVAPLVGFPASRIGAGVEAAKNAQKEGMTAADANSMLIYSNYNFLDVKLELQVRTQDGNLKERPMAGPVSPPGLRFPNGGVLDNSFVISGTYLTSSRQEYALWALDLKTMTWSRIDVGGSVFGQGSWNRGVLWPKRNTFVILGNRKRNLVEDYNHRRINFSNICLVELEAFGLYDNPRVAKPGASYSSYSAPELPSSLRPKASLWSGGGRPHFSAAEDLGRLALNLKEVSDMDILTLSGERIPVNSHILARRWGPYFVQILREGANAPQPSITRSMDELGLGADDKDTNTIRNAAGYRNSSVTITPSLATAYTSATTLTVGSQTSGGTATLAGGSSGHAPSASISSTNTALTNGTASGNGPGDDSVRPFHAPSPASLPASTRSRTLYLPHTGPTVHALLHFLYTSTLPSSGHPLSTPQILCSLLQLARPYRIDGLLEAVLQRLHQAMDSRSAAAVFNACAMAAGGGRGTGFEKFGGGTVLVSEAELDEARDLAAAEIGTTISIGHVGAGSASNMKGQTGAGGTNRLRGAQERKNTFDQGDSRTAKQSADRRKDSTDVSEDEGASGTDTEAGSITDSSEVWDDGLGGVPGPGAVGDVDEEIWTGDRSCVIGLQKRGLRGLMEGRRQKERVENGETLARTPIK